MQEEAGTPAVALPPRHARLREGMLARLTAQDLAGQISAGRALEASVATNAREGEAIAAWCSKSVEQLRAALVGVGNDAPPGYTGLWIPGEGVWRGFEYAIHHASDHATRLSLGLGYLEEVLQRMPDYAEASGQTAPEPGLSVSISGGTVNIPQLAARINNINSTITGVVHQSGTNVAEALRELQRAVVAQEGLEDTERQTLLDNVEYLATAANTPPEGRNRGLVTSVLLALTTAAAGAEQLQRVMDTWGGVLQGLIP
ncbi:MULTISPECIES: hypothetical protein [Streptomyces]|uniref:hypothetical protein n=1 Tax=Streptomyces TaxID=1883 RepID=UPI001109F1F2|nr:MULTISPECIES: hypothetical protein [Streptomyces]